MIYRMIFPKEGGGWARRYLRFRQDIFRQSVKAKDKDPCPPMTLFDFLRHDDAVDAAKIQGKTDKRDGWRISDDRVIGGFTKSSAALLRTREDLERYLKDPKLLEEEVAETEENTATPLPFPFIRWKGTLDTTVGLQSDAHRSGFAAIRSPEFPFEGANLQGMYNALELLCRSTDGRTYTVNLKVSTSIPDDIYQGKIDPSPTNPAEEKLFTKLVIPFESFRITSMGREREVNRALDDNVKIESVGIALLDGIEGDFQLDVARIRAVNVTDDGFVFEGPSLDETEKEVEETVKQ